MAGRSRGAVWAAVLAAGLAGPGAALAQTPPGEACAQVWSDLIAGSASGLAISGEVEEGKGGWCIVRNVVLDSPARYSPDPHIRELRFAGRLGEAVPGPAAAAQGSALDSLQIEIDGLTLPVRTDDPATDYLLAAQAQVSPMSMRFQADWDRDARRLKIVRFDLALWGENRITLRAVIDNVDLSSKSATQMALAGFTIREADLTITTRGLFETFVLPMLISRFDPTAGTSVEAQAEVLRQSALDAVAALPEPAFAPDSKAALGELLRDLPNPAGTLRVQLRAKTGFGPARLMSYAMTGVPQSGADLAPLFDGATFGIDWERAAPK